MSADRGYVGEWSAKHDKFVVMATELIGKNYDDVEVIVMTLIVMILRITALMAVKMGMM